MILKKLRLHNFRNYTNIEASFEEGIHILFGKNAQGKTNFLEAIYYLSTTRSHRGVREDDLVFKHQSYFFIQAELYKKNHLIPLQISIDEKGKHLSMYRNSVKKVSDFIGECNAILFCPDDLLLFSASPKVRRRFVDMELSKISKTYVNTLFLVQRLLKERNRYLKKEKQDDTYLDVLTQQLVDASVIIVKQRYHFLQALINQSKSFYQELSNDGTQLSLVYDSCIPYSEDDQKMKECLLEKYQTTLAKDRILKSTSIGIHKEDFIFKLNDNEVSNYASQGQKRSILLALKVGLIHMIFELTKEYPVLLLDDVFSELDVERRMKLLTSLPKEVQIFITTTEIEEFKTLRLSKPLYFWKVTNGIIEKFKEDSPWMKNN